MKILKFRAWDKPINRWYSPVYEAYKGQLEELSIGMSGRLSLRTMKGTADESTFKDRFIISQYTGLKDKNGKEIYEGDILTHSDYEKPLYVYFCNDCAQFRIQLKGFGNNEPIDTTGDEVIGNIYENKDLL